LVKLDYRLFKSVANAFFGMFIVRRTRPTFFDVQFSSARLARQRIAA
jgi:hypothetical protein